MEYLLAAAQADGEWRGHNPVHLVLAVLCLLALASVVWGGKR